jgi:catechol 2,3-dioxygenase-like lactoylglutathione lyase family enzyme
MVFHNIVPILYSSDVVKSIQYYTEVLGFQGKWEWGTPPTFGGVSLQGIEIFFCEKGQGNPGTWLSIFVDNADEYYETIKARGAKIITPPTTYEWGVHEMLVEDPDGHKIRFGHSVPCPPEETKTDSVR